MKIKNEPTLVFIIFPGEILTPPELGERSKKLRPLISIQGVGDPSEEFDHFVVPKSSTFVPKSATFVPFLSEKVQILSNFVIQKRVSLPMVTVVWHLFHTFFKQK